LRLMGILSDNDNLTPMRLMLIVVTLILIVAATSWTTTYPGLNSGHDLNHLARIHEMASGIQEGSFPVIWSQNLLFGYGMPLFQFYAPLPYYFGAVIYLLGISLPLSVKILILLANVFTALGAYLLGFRLFKNTWAGLISSMLITLAPYRAVDLFVRAALSEAWAIMFICWAMLGILLVSQKARFGMLVLVSSLVGIVLSHNLSVMIAAPFLVCFGIFCGLYFNLSWFDLYRTWKNLLLSILVVVGLTSYYVFPVLLEKDFTQIDLFTTGSNYDFRQHFLYIRQLLKPWGDWEWGGSGWGPDDEMSFFLGYSALFMVIIAVSWLFYIMIKSRRVLYNRRNWLLVFLLSQLGLSLFLTLTKSAFIWNMFSFTDYIQFPWRFLTIGLIYLGLVGGFVVMFIKIRYQPLAALVVLIVTLITNTHYFKPEKYFDVTRQISNYAAVIRSERSDNLFDYMPRDIIFFEQKGYYIRKIQDFSDIPVPTESLFLNSFEETNSPSLITNKTTQKEFWVQLAEPTLVTLALAYYPGWEVTINGKPQDLWPNENGLVSFQLEQGKQNVRVTLEDTPIRFWSKVISLGTLILLLLIIIGVNFKSEINKLRFYLYRLARM
jgi:hypothetical protein